MTRKMFALHPEMKYAEFHERALFNHILGSQDSEDGRTCYMVPVGRGVQREYADMFRSFTCCVGTGMESHALHGDGLYYESGDKLWVNIYAPSTAKWGEVDLAMDTTFPEGDAATLKLTMKAAKQFTLALRRPSWAGAGFAVKVNGQAVKQLSAPGTYVELKRKWKTGDSVTLALVKTLHLEPLPDNPSITAIMWGPIVLAGDLGPERERRRGAAGQVGTQQPVAQIIKIPSLVAAERTPSTWIKALADKPGAFRTNGAGREQDVDLVPFYRLHRRTYSVYFDLFTPAEWEKKAVALLAEREQQRKLEAATIAYVEAGEVYFERDFNQQGEETTPLRNQGRPGRSARKWFSYDIPVDATHPLKLIATYHGEERATRTFEILVDGTRIGEQRIERHRPGSATKSFFDVEYAIPAEAVQGKQKVTVRFQATGGNETAGVFGVRLVRANN